MRYDFNPADGTGNWSPGANDTLQSGRPLSRAGLTAVTLVSVKTDTPAALLYGGEARLSRYLGLSFDDAWLFDYDDGSWERQASEAYPPLRISHSAITTTDFRMIVYGGLSIVHGFLNDVWALTLSSLNGPLHEWEQLPVEAPIGLVGRSSHSAVVVSGSSDGREEMIIYGGTNTLPAGDTLDDCWVSAAEVVAKARRQIETFLPGLGRGRVAPAVWAEVVSAPLSW